MLVPDKRNKKKQHHKARSPYAVLSRRSMFDRLTDTPPEVEGNPEDGISDFDKWLNEIDNPGGWLENQYYQEPDRLLQPDNEYEPDMGDMDYYEDGDYYEDNQ